MVLEQINTDQNKESISVNELRDAVKPGGFLDNENKNYNENIKLVGDLLNNSEQLSKEDKALTESLKSTLNTEKEKIKNGHIITEEDKNLLKVRIDLLGKDSQEVQELEDLISSYIDINVENNVMSQQYETIRINFEKLSANDKNLLNKLNIGSDLPKDIDLFLDKRYINLSNKDTIQAVNILNNIIKEDQKRHEILENIVKSETLEMSKHVNNEIGGNKKSNADYYSDEQKMLIQLWANVCYGETLTIDGKRGEQLFSFRGKNENQRLTTVYIYRLELITRQDVITYRHEHKDLKTTDNLLNVPELDEMLSVLPRAEQNKVLECFLDESFFDVRVCGLFFEDKIGNEYFKELLDLAIKTCTEKEVSIEQGIADREALLKNLSLHTDRNKPIIKNIQEELIVLRTKDPVSGEYKFKTMGEYYQQLFDNLKNDIKKQNENNVDISYRQYAKNEIMDVLMRFNNLIEFNELEDPKGNLDEFYKGQIIEITKTLAAMYNDQSVPKYKEWIESGEIIDPYLLKSIAVKFCTYLNENEQKQYETDFLEFMKKCRNEVYDDFNQFSGIVDITTQIDALEDGMQYELFDLNKLHELCVKKYGDDYFPHKHEYTLKLGSVCFTGGERVKDLYENQIQTGGINVVITPKGQNFCLCKYEKHDGEIWLYEFDENGKLPDDDNPTKKISGQDIVHSNLVMSSAMDSLNTEGFQKVIKEFDEKELGSYAEIQKSINGFLEKYNNKDLSDDDQKEMQRDIAQMMTHLKSLKENNGINHLEDLKKELEKMLGNNNGIENPYEQNISLRIKQIDSLIQLCNEEGEYYKYLSMIANLTSNDNWYERIDLQEVFEIALIIGGFIAGVLLAPATGGASLLISITCGAAFGAVLGGCTAAIHYVGTQTINTIRNYHGLQVKQVCDRDGHIVEIPGYVRDEDKTLFTKLLTHEIEFPEFLKESHTAYSQEVLSGMITGAILGGIGGGFSTYLDGLTGPGKLYTQSQARTLDLIYNSISNGDDLMKLYNSMISVCIVTDVVRGKWTKPEANNVTIMSDIANYFDILIPQKLKEKGEESILNGLLGNVTCKNIDNNGNLVMEYNPSDRKFKALIAEYREENASVNESEDGVITVISKNGEVRYEPSELPVSYRQLPQTIRNNMNNIGGVNINDITGEITYKNPEGLGDLRSLGAYMENSGEGKIFISDNGLAKLTYRQGNGENVIVTIQPEMT